MPGLDGRVQPLPKPELNLEDHHLVAALDELAGLGETGHPQPEPAAAALAVSEPESQSPQILPEPIPIELPLPPEPVRPSVGGLAQPETATLDRAALEQELTTLAAQAPALATPAIAEAEPLSPPDRWWPPLLIGAVVAAAAFASGLFVGRRSAPSAPPTIAQPEPEQPTPVEESSAAVVGRITYQTDSGDSRPDRGARVIVFPIEADLKNKLPVLGFRPADTSAEFESAAATWQALDGALATVDDRGEYRLDLPAAGTYPILVLSRFQTRDESQPIDGELQKLLSRYFERPEDLLGRLKFHFGKIHYRGTATEVWDHAF